MMSLTKNDSDLLGKLKSSFTSENDKKLVDKILMGRGYVKNKNGSYSRL